MEPLICPSCTTIQVNHGRRCNWCGITRPTKGWIGLDTVADPWLGTELDGGLRVEQRISSVESLYRADNEDGERFFARFRRINRLATPPDWPTRASRLRSIRSRRLARFVRAFEHDEYAVVLSEHIEGERLRDLLRRCGPLPAADAVLIAQQIAMGVEALHRVELTHGRLTPRGIVVSNDQRGSRRVTLISYGLASGLEPPAPERGYLPDDRLDGAAASDVFAIGAILFELLTNVAPIDATVDESIRELAPGPLKNPSALNPALGCAPYLDELVQRFTTDDTPSIEEAIELLADAYDNPSSAELGLGSASPSFLGVDTGVGSALSSSAVGAPPDAIVVDRDAGRTVLQARGTTVTIQMGQQDPVVLLDVGAHNVQGQVSQMKVVGDYLLVGTTRGALVCASMCDGSFEALTPWSDGSAIIQIDAAQELAVAATRRGSIIVCDGTDGARHIMAATALVTSVSVAENGKRFAIGRVSGEVEVFDLVDGLPVGIDEFMAAEVTGIRLSADGKELWLSDPDTTTVRDLATHSNCGVVGAASELVETSESLVYRRED